MIALGWIGMIAISCNKASPLQDKIIYVDLDSNYMLHPVDSLTYQLISCAIPWPNDSMVTLDLDMNQDGVNDFRFTYAIWYRFISASNPCSNFNSYVNIEGLANGNKIRVSSQDQRVISVLNEDHWIASDQLFGNDAIIFTYNSGAQFSFNDFLGEGYIGIQLSKGELGWIKLNFDEYHYTCEIMEYAYNATSNAPIKAGATP